MSRPRCAQCGLFGLAALLLFLSPLRAADPAVEVKARIAAGEFGPALAAAGAVADPAQRDQLLGNIAAAQARAGGRRAALDTAADLSSDVVRKAALGSLSESGSSRGPMQGARGGGAFADFDSLIELITSTIKPDSWDDVGGPGAIDSFAGGVYVDSAGLLRKLPTSTDLSLIAVRRAGMEAASATDPHRSSVLRKVSLPRLEREVQLLAAQGRQPSEAMQTLAGLKRIKYILVYPETGDIVLAGPAGDWRRDAEGRYVDTESGAPVVNLDDLVVTLRNAYGPLGIMRCSIEPRKDNLAAAKVANEKWSKQPLKSATQRQKWLEDVRAAIGRQDIELDGIDRRTHVGRVLVEADYRMKLVGIGLEEALPGVTSYLSAIELDKDGNPPAMKLLRLWFVLNYSSLAATDGRDAFELKGSGVKVLSENEMLNQRGERVQTGASDEPAMRFAETFTKHFDKLSAKYPIYAELRNIFDLSLVAAVMQSHDLPGQVGWHMTHFGPGGDHTPALGPAPTEVDTVIHHRLIGNKVIAVASGGVRVDARELAGREAVKTDTYGQMAGERRASTPQELPRRAWWWD